jgi:hypothetical protein
VGKIVFSGLRGTPKREHREEKHCKSTKHLSEFGGPTNNSIDTVIKLIKHFGRHCLMAKCDIEDAFRLVPIHPTDYHLLGFTWNNLYYYDRCLPMGASSSC